MLTTLFGAASLALAAPATAGQATPADPHAGHAQHKGMDHSQHDKAGHDCKKCCEDAKKTGAKMECGMDAKSGDKPAAGEHQQHDH